MTQQIKEIKQPKLDPLKFTDEDLFDSLPNDTNTYATLAEVCQKLCSRIMHDTSKEQGSRRIEQTVRRRLLEFGDNYSHLIEIDIFSKPHRYRKKVDVNAENKQTIRQLSVLQDLIGQYLPIDQQRLLEKQVTDAHPHSWKQFIYVAPSSICTAPQCTIDIKTKVYTAIEQQQALAFTYLNGDRDISQKRLMPWGLMFKGEKTYVVGMEQNNKGTRPAIYAMHRMSEMSILDADDSYKAKPASMTIAEICKLHGFDRFKRKTDPIIHLTLRLFGKAANNIDGTPISDDQIVEEIAEGVRELRATILWGDELEKFIRGLGPHAEVIEPVALRQKLAEEYQQLALRYGHVSAPKLAAEM